MVQPVGSGHKKHYQWTNLNIYSTNTETTRHFVQLYNTARRHPHQKLNSKTRQRRSLGLGQKISTTTTAGTTVDINKWMIFCGYVERGLSVLQTNMPFLIWNWPKLVHKAPRNICAWLHSTTISVIYKYIYLHTLFTTSSDHFLSLLHIIWRRVEILHFQ